MNSCRRDRRTREARYKMSENARDELDLLVERALKDWISHEVPPDRVWTSIKLGLVGRVGRSPSRLRWVRQLWTEGVAMATDVLVAARMIVSPAPHGGENGWTSRLVVVGRSSASVWLSTHR